MCDAPYNYHKVGELTILHTGFPEARVWQLRLRNSRSMELMQDELALLRLAGDWLPRFMGKVFLQPDKQGQVPSRAAGERFPEHARGHW